MSNNGRKKIDFHKDWPSLTEDGKISTAQFLDTCGVIIQFLGVMGNLFLPIRKDVEGNIKKLYIKYHRNPSKYSTIQEMITIDTSSVESPCAVESLKWLKRGLHFVFLVLDNVVEGYELKTNQDLVDSCLKAYEISLKNYHNWILQKFAETCIRRICPSRDHFMLCIRNCDEEDEEEEIFLKVKKFVGGLEANLQCIFNLYVDYGFDTIRFVK